MGISTNLLNEMNSFYSNKVDKIIIKNIHEDIINKGIWPKFGSPETRCNKCMFYGITCAPRHDRIGCLGGWKME